MQQTFLFLVHLSIETYNQSRIKTEEGVVTHEVAQASDVAQDFLHVINDLLKANAVLFNQMIDSKDAEVMIRELLLHPVLPELQNAVHDMLREAILEGGAPHAQFWLLSVRLSVKL